MPRKKRNSTPPAPVIVDDALAEIGGADDDEELTGADLEAFHVLSVQLQKLTAPKKRRVLLAIVALFGLDLYGDDE